MENFEAAIEDYDQAIQLNPDYAMAYENRATAKLFNNQPDEALFDLNEAIRIKPDFANAFAFRGEIKAILFQIDEARSDYQTALELAEQQNDTALKADIDEKLQRLNDSTPQTDET